VNAKKFFAEMKRRNVYKVAIVFGVVMSMAGWISSARKGVKFLAGLRYAH